MSEQYEVTRKATIVANGEHCAEGVEQKGTCPQLCYGTEEKFCGLFAAELDGWLTDRCPACLSATEGMKPKEQGHEVG